jgi:hypothetical protein
VQGPVPARFTVAIGTTEQFGTPVNDVTNREVGVAGVKEWYATPPPNLVPQVEVAVTADSPTTADQTTIAGETSNTRDTLDVVEETVPPVGSEGSPTTAVVLGAGAIVIVGLGVRASRRRRR